VDRVPVSRNRGAWRGRRFRLLPLAACLALAFATGTPGAGNDLPTHGLLSVVDGRHVAHFARASSNAASAVTHHVNNCADPLPVPSTCAETVEFDPDGIFGIGFKL